ncbi:F-box only protein 16 [Aplochiton taeniatus]
MSFAPSSFNAAKMQTKMSAWTPLNHQTSNNNVFVERKILLGKWFDKWSPGQRKAIFQDFFSRCSPVQLRALHQSLGTQVPVEATDFTCLLPRVLSLYVFSFLDPRSLCRCAQVSWHWRSTVELDQLWMPKCLRLGWCINFSPTPFEQGVWKRHYIETVQELHVSRPKTPILQEFVVPEVNAMSSSAAEERLVYALQHGRGTSGRGLGSHLNGLPQWRGPDKNPKDTLRFNYLANLDPIEQAVQAQTKNRGLSATKRDNAKRKPTSDSRFRLRKSKSLMFLSLDLNSNHRAKQQQQQHQNQPRPAWATRSLDYPVTKETAKSLVGSVQWNAGIRPGPVRLTVPRLRQGGQRASQSSHRCSPSTPLFEGQPWKVPASDQGSNED